MIRGGCLCGGVRFVEILDELPQLDKPTLKALRQRGSNAEPGD